jgi:hypothetical protein
MESAIPGLDAGAEEQEPGSALERAALEPGDLVCQPPTERCSERGDREIGVDAHLL